MLSLRAFVRPAHGRYVKLNRGTREYRTSWDRTTRFQVNDHRPLRPDSVAWAIALLLIAINEAIIIERVGSPSQCSPAILHRAPARGQAEMPGTASQ